MKRTIARSALRTVLALLMLVAGMRTLASAQSVNAHENRIVGVWDVQVKVLDCSTGDPIASFRGLHKYELGGTAQVVPSTNPAALSPHVGIWTTPDREKRKFSILTAIAWGQAAQHLAAPGFNKKCR